MRHLMTRSIVLAALFLAAVLDLIGCGPSRPTPSGVSQTTAAATQPAGNAQAPVAVNVAIDNFSYTPAVVTIHAGTQVTWVNHDDVPHTVTASDKSFTSAALDTDDHYSRVFSQPGTYSYYCAVHPHMTGKVVVTN